MELLKDALVFVDFTIDTAIARINPAEIHLNFAPEIAERAKTEQ
jgi:hypothetical protein